MSSSNLADIANEPIGEVGSASPDQLSSNDPSDHSHPLPNDDALARNEAIDPQTLVSMDTDGERPREHDAEGEATTNSTPDGNKENDDVILSVPAEPNRVNSFSTEYSSDPELSDEIRPGAVYVEGSDSFDSMTEDSDTESIDSVLHDLNPEVEQEVPLPVAVVAEIQEENVEETVQNILGDTDAMLEAFGNDVAIAEEISSPGEESISPGNEKRPPPFWSKKKKRMVGLFTIVVVIVASIVAAVASNSSSEETLVDEEKNTTSTEPTTTRYKLIKQIALGISGQDVVEAENTFQHAALFWLAENDTFDGLDIMNEKEVVQRYALAVFYFATNGDHWNNSYGFLSPVNECDWKGRDKDNFLQGVAHCQDGAVDELFFSANNLTGSIPNEIGELLNMTSLTIAYDPLKGEIPDSITKLKSLTNLVLLATQLQGSIPNDIGKLTKLKTLKLNFNKISGPIPASIGNITKLEEIYLEENELTGHLPESMGNLANLKQLFLYTNHLSGALPSSFSQLTQLKNIFLSKNDITGGFNNLCGVNFHLYESDCGVPIGQDHLKKPEVNCSCCNYCCVNGKDCQLIY